MAGDKKSNASGRPQDEGSPAVDPTPVKSGTDVIKSYLKTLGDEPGVYRMLNDAGDVLYVGKAKNLKKRVASYSRTSGHTTRILRMIAATRTMVFVTTNTEAEALLLEANLIKRFRPPANVVLRDDKSFPYILLRTDHPWAQITKHRGARKRDGVYYGPFASAGAVNQTLNTLQRVFLLRSCSDSTLENRTRPCLLYQIKRCSAPCVDHVGTEDYAALVKDAKAFLSGRSQDIQKRLSADMELASDALDFEAAAVLRDRLRALAHVQSHQGVNAAHVRDADVIASETKGGLTCVQVFFYRSHQNWGNSAHFLRHRDGDNPAHILGAFISQFYDNKPPPRLLIVQERPVDAELLEEALAVRLDHAVRIHVPQRGEKKELVDNAARNARHALDRRLAESASQQKLLSGVADLFGLEAPPGRIEVYDNSHIAGTGMVGGMIVSGPEGFEKTSYRKFNIKDETLSPGDDYGMMREVMTRRFSRLVREDEARDRGHWPDLVLIDGGEGQLSVVMATLTELGLEDVPLVAISKGPDRNAGRETFHMPGRDSFTLEPGHAVLYFLQRLRDEAHRFAITAQRAKRKQAMHRSPLDGVPGVGAKRKRALLNHFGSAKSVERAGLKDLEVVEGISTAMALTIFDYFRG